ncbi:MAG: hypothetical protein H6Q06_1089 [Acidobacteria bacterium]|nr:hypothetical protein [Acidobacteriota bacterium]
MNHKGNSRRTKLLLFSALAVQLAAAWSMPQLSAAPPDNGNDNAPLQVGYVVVTPATTPENIAVFETFGERHGGQTLQAGILPSAMTTHAVLFVNTSGRLSRNVGVAIANPGSDPAEIGLALYGEDGKLLADYASSNDPLVLAPGEQVAKYVTELFESEPDVQRDFAGTLHLTSNVPVAVLGIRARGINFSTLPATSVSGPSENSTAIVLAHFAVGGGWATEIVIANTGPSDIEVRVDLFKQDGTPLEVRLNDLTDSSFTVPVLAHGVATLAPRDGNGDSDF